MTALTIACIAASIAITTSGDFHLPPPPPLPAPARALAGGPARAAAAGGPARAAAAGGYATQEWIHYAASIVAGETVPHCATCDQWIACTIKRDIEDGRHPWALYPDRWHRHRTPSPAHLAAIETALTEQGCLNVPTCAYLGNLNDYRYWSSGPAQGVPSHVVGNRHGAIVCIPPPPAPATPLPAPSTAATATPGSRQPPSPAPARPRRAGHADE